MITKFHKYSAINEERPAPRIITYAQKENSKKITEYCEEYVTDILDDCKLKNISVTSSTIPSGLNYEWCLIIKDYYPIKIDSLIKRISLEFEVKNWWIESSGTSSPVHYGADGTKIPNSTKLTLSLFPKIEL